MIIERNTFRLKFGKAKESIAIWKEIMEAGKGSTHYGLPPQMRLMTDLSGTAYTLEVELHINSFQDVNPKNAIWATNPKLQELYQKFIPLCDSATREYFKIEGMT